MSTPGVGPITALAVAAAFDDAARFRRSSTAGAYLGLTPRRLRIRRDEPQTAASRSSDRMTRTHLYGAANAIMTQARRVAPARMGARDRRAHRVGKGQGRPGAEARRDPACDVAQGTPFQGETPA
jgi:transposase